MHGTAVTSARSSINWRDDFVRLFSEAITSDNTENVRALKLLGRIGRSDIVWDRVARAYNLLVKQENSQEPADA